MNSIVQTFDYRWRCISSRSTFFSLDASFPKFGGCESDKLVTFMIYVEILTLFTSYFLFILFELIVILWLVKLGVGLVANAFIFPTIRWLVFDKSECRRHFFTYLQLVHLYSKTFWWLPKVLDEFVIVNKIHSSIL